MPAQIHADQAKLRFDGRQVMTDACNIKVVCRVRPLNSKEQASGNTSAVKFPAQNAVEVGVRRGIRGLMTCNVSQHVKNNPPRGGGGEGGGGMGALLLATYRH